MGAKKTHLFPENGRRYADHNQISIVTTITVATVHEPYHPPFFGIFGLIVARTQGKVKHFPTFSKEKRRKVKLPPPILILL